MSARGAVRGGEAGGAIVSGRRRQQVHIAGHLATKTARAFVRRVKRAAENIFDFNKHSFHSRLLSFRLQTCWWWFSFFKRGIVT